MFDSDLGRDEGSVVRRRAFLLTSASALAGAILWSLRRPNLVQGKAVKGASEEVTIVEFSDSGERLKTDGASSCPGAFSQSLVTLTPSWPTPERTGTSTRKVSTAVFAVTMHCSPRTRSSIPERVGRASGRRSRVRTFELRETPAWAWSEQLSHAPNVTHIWDTYSTMAQNLRACAIASIQRP